MRAPTSTSGPRGRAEHSPLPDFCGLPALFALFVVGALTVTVMWLARDERNWSAYSVSMLFVTWMVLVVAVALCKLRPLLQRLPGLTPYVGVWLLIVLIVTVASIVARWLDSSLQMHLIGSSTPAFVRDNAFIAALLGAAMLRYFYVLAQWQARLAAVTRAQVEALQARIRPHFLFNSMNTVAALIRVDPAAAERTVEDLSELFRAALGQHDTGDDTLGDELALIERYLAIEQLRCPSAARLHVRRANWMTCPPGTSRCHDCCRRPLVENAVRHGIQPLLEGGEVILRGRLLTATASASRSSIRCPAVPLRPATATAWTACASASPIAMDHVPGCKPARRVIASWCNCTFRDSLRDARTDR